MMLNSDSAIIKKGKQAERVTSAIRSSSLKIRIKRFHYYIGIESLSK